MAKYLVITQRREYGEIMVESETDDASVINALVAERAHEIQWQNPHDDKHPNDWEVCDVEEIAEGDEHLYDYL